MSCERTFLFSNGSLQNTNGNRKFFGTRGKSSKRAISFFIPSMDVKVRFYCRALFFLPANPSNPKVKMRNPKKEGWRIFLQMQIAKERVATSKLGEIKLPN